MEWYGYGLSRLGALATLRLQLRAARRDSRDRVSEESAQRAHRDVEDPHGGGCHDLDVFAMAHDEADQRDRCAEGRWLAFGVESSGSGETRRLNEECLEVVGWRDANLQQRGLRSVVDEGVSHSGIRADAIARPGRLRPAVDKEGDIAGDDLPVLALGWMEVLGHVSAGVGFDFGEQVAAVA